MLRRFSTTVLLLICLLQGAIIGYWGSEMLVNQFVTHQETSHTPRESVNVVAASRGNFTGNITTYGKVKCENHATLKVPNLGSHKVQVSAINFKAGDFVKKGMVLVTFYCEELDHKILALLKDWEHNQKYLQRVMRASSNVSENEKEEARIKTEKSQEEYFALFSFYNSLNIKAPFSGYIGIPNIVEGEQAVSDKYVANIVSKGDLIVEFYIDPEQSVHVKTGDNIVVSTIDTKDHCTGTIIGMNPYIDENNSKIKVVAKLIEDKEKYDKFKHNLNVRIYIDKVTIENVFILPCSTIVNKDGSSRTGNDTFVAKVERNYHGYEAKLVSVNLIDTKGDICAVVGGIEEGDYIVCEGVIKQDGIPVYVKEIID